MSDGKEVKRFRVSGFTQAPTGKSLLAADHCRIVAELNAKYKELSDFNDACRKVRYRQEGELAELNARLDKVNDVYKMWVKELETIAELRAEVERLKGKLLTVTTMESNYKMLQGELTESRAEVEDLKSVQEALIETAKKNQDYYEFEYSRFSKLLATRARGAEVSKAVIEKLREQRNAWKMYTDGYKDEMSVEEMDKELAAIEKEGAKDDNNL